MKTYLVGGAVRDQLMGNDPKDRDYVVVGSSPEEMLSLGFEQVGAAFPVFLHPETREEYALARTERKVGEGYHGFEVAFGPDVTLEEDLARRDLTINSIAFDGATFEFIDPYGGIDDIKMKVLHHTSDAFKEDPLRVIRLCRFAARMLDFSIHPDTMDMAKALVKSGELNTLSTERFVAEIEKVLKTCKAFGCSLFFKMLDNLEASEYIDFFRGQDLTRLSRLAGNIVDTPEIPVEQRLAVFAGCASPASLDWALTLGGSEGLMLARVLAMLRGPASLVQKVDRLMGAYARCGWQNTARVELAATAIAQSFMVGDLLPVDALTFTTGFKIIQPVSSQLAANLAGSGMSGRHLGAEIARVRHEDLTNFLDMQWTR